MKLALVAAAVTAAAAQPASRPAPPPARFADDAIGYLCYHSTGKLDDRDLTGGQVALWNTIIGEGDAAAPELTITATLSGKAGKGIKKATLPFACGE